MLNEPTTLGCVIEPPDDRDYLYSDIAGGKIDLPLSFVVDAPHMYQNGIDSCVGHACAAAKSVQEDEKLSPRYQWHLAKKAQFYLRWGTSITLCLDGMIKEGSLPYGTFDENVHVDRKEYMRLEPTEEQKKLAEKYKIKSYWRAGYGNRDVQSVKQALYEQKTPLITSMLWYKEYDVPVKGFLPKGKTESFGHAFILKGWDVDKDGREYLIFQNSWKKTWGDNGDFYVYTDELGEYKMASFFVLMDIESDKAKILSRYKNKLIKNTTSPKVYYVGAGKIAWVKDEDSFRFGRDSGFWGNWSDIIDIEEEIKEDIIF